MNRKELTDRIFKRRSYLCVGLDSDIDKIPAHLLKEADPVFEFNKQVIDATREYCVAYKLNTAFYEALGRKGWETIEKTVDYIGADHFRIADAKRGDIGNTSTQYAKAFFEKLSFDAITVAPYMGGDSVKPFLEYPGKWTILLGLTSNPGAADFELKKAGNEYLYESVLKTATKWGSTENLMFVVGATQASEFKNIRKITPGHFYLVPGVGAQGGSLKDISQAAMIGDCGLLINVSRAIIFASGKADFAIEAAKAASKYQQEMGLYLQSEI
jgi:orotidine-5'-phosphate decarboxylase